MLEVPTIEPHIIPADLLYPERTQKQRQKVCTTCNSKITGFRDKLSQEEFIISGMCQKCQDEVFNACEE